MSKIDFSIAKIIGKAIMLSSIQVAFGSVEMSSRFSVINFSKEQDTLQNAANALSAYILIGTAWSIGTILVLWSSYGLIGFLAGLICNLIIMLWIVISYKMAFKSAAKKYNLREPKLFQSIV